MSENGYSGRTVLVTGGTSTIGLSLAGLLMDQGLTPILTCRNSVGKEKITEALAGRSGMFETVLLDLSDPESINDLFKTDTPGPDYLVDLAQTDYESLVAAADETRMDNYLNQNINARARLVRQASRHMVQKRFGRLIFISSAAAEKPGHGQGFYAASKLAGEALYKNCGLELCSKGVTAISIRTGLLDAGRGKTFIENRGKEKQAGALPPLTSVTQVCEAILFFLSDAAHAFNGVSVTMDYGVSAGKN